MAFLTRLVSSIGPGNRNKPRRRLRTAGSVRGMDQSWIQDGHSATRWPRVASEHEAKAGDFDLIPVPERFAPERVDPSTVQDDPVMAVEILKHECLTFGPDHGMSALDPDD